MNYLSPVAQTLYEDDVPMDAFMDYPADTWYGYYVLDNPALGTVGILSRDAEDTVDIKIYTSFREAELAWSKLF